MGVRNPCHYHHNYLAAYVAPRDPHTSEHLSDMRFSAKLRF